MTHIEELSFSNDTANLPRLRAFMAKVVKTCRVEDKYTNKIILAVDEAVSNIIEHAYAETEEGKADIKIKVEGLDDLIRITINDRGTHFEPCDVETPNIKRHIQEGRKNGLGIFLMRQIMDEVTYNFKSGTENELVMVKYFRD